MTIANLKLSPEELNARQETPGAFGRRIYKIKRITPHIGTVIIVGSINGEDGSRTLTVREALERAKALSDMRDKLRFPDERSKIQNIIDELIEACRVAREKLGDPFISPRVSMSGAMYRERKSAKATRK